MQDFCLSTACVHKAFVTAAFNTSLVSIMCQMATQKERIQSLKPRQTMERGLNCVKDVTTLPDGTSPGGEEVLRSVMQQFFCVNNAFSLGERLVFFQNAILGNFLYPGLNFSGLFTQQQMIPPLEGLLTLNYFYRDWKDLLRYQSDPRVHISTANFLKCCRSVLSWARFTTLVCFEAAGSRVVCSSQVSDGCGVSESDVHR